MMIKHLLAAALVLAVFGCATAPARGKLDATLVPHKIYCPTDNKEAMRLFNKATGIHHKPAQAKILYQKAIALDPGYCDAMDNLGVLYRHDGNLKEAESWYRKSIEKNARNPVPHINIGIIHLMRGENDKALGEYNKVIEIEPDNPEGYYSTGTALFNMGRYQEAIAPLEKARELYSATQTVLIGHADYMLGMSNAGAGHWDKSREYLLRVYPIFEKDPMINFTLGLSYNTDGFEDLEIAKNYLKRSMELGHPGAWLVLSEIEDKQNKSRR